MQHEQPTTPSTTGGATIPDETIVPAETREARLYLARDYLDEGLKGPSEGLAYRLRQILEANLLDPELRHHAENLWDSLEIVTTDICHELHHCSEASNLFMVLRIYLHREPKSLAEEVEQYREAAFYGFRTDREIMRGVEMRISAFQDMYASALRLLEEIDAALGVPIRHPELPKIGPNRFEKIVAELDVLEADRATRARRRKGGAA